jgi:putative ABC transport system ATP-binding protein
MIAMAGKDVLIHSVDITKVYDMGAVQVEALRGVTLTIETGSFVSIMGPSGSGKTTLMDILGCLSRPTAGSYYLKGQEVNNLLDNSLAALRNREIGFVFQTFNLLPRSTALANVELPLVYDNVPGRERRRRAGEMLEQVGLGDRLYHRPSELSGGQRQKVAIARALVNNPSIIFADEPTGNLDSGSGAEIMAIFDELHRKGNTIVMVTHEEYIADHAERIVHVRDGRLVDENPESRPG